MRKHIEDVYVTPYVGVWIETTNYLVLSSHCQVTPYVGVWIETPYPACQTCELASLLMWECGLKLNKLSGWERATRVTPYVGVWIETPGVHHIGSDRKSLLMWECGLKQKYVDMYVPLCWSLLMWECGLKLCSPNM